MDTNNRRSSAQTGDDWRKCHSRQSIVIYLMKSLNRLFPFSGQEGQGELKKIAVQFEEKICTAAISPFDYREKILLMKFSFDSTLQNKFPNSLPPNPSGSNNRPPHSGGYNLSCYLSLNSEC